MNKEVENKEKDLEIFSESRYNVLDLINHTNIAQKFQALTQEAIDACREERSITGRFLGKNEWFWVSMVFLAITLLLSFLSEFKIVQNIQMGFGIAFIITFGFKLYYFYERRSMRKYYKNECEEKIEGLKEMLTGGNSLNTYIAISYNSLYKIPFDRNLYKKIKKEVENSNSKNRVSLRLLVEVEKELEKVLKK